MPAPAPHDVRTPAASSAISGHLDTRTAATELADHLAEGFGSSSCNLAFVFGSYHHRAAFADACAIIRGTLAPDALLGVTAESVLGDDRELEGRAGMAAIALRIPGAALSPWVGTPDSPLPISDMAAFRSRIGVNDDLRAAFMFGDPFSTPITRLLPAMMTAGVDDQPIPVMGGMASGGSQPGMNVLVMNDEAINAGVIGVTVSGDVAVDSVVSQGCRPIGSTFVITRSKGNVVQELGGRRALDALQEMAERLPESDKRLLSQGLLLGTAINEYKEHLGRGDFLVRNVLGIDKESGAIAVGEMARMGQTVQFHVRDAATASEDLQLLLDAQMLDAPPFAALLFSCNGRGERLFGEPNHDLGIIRSRFESLPIAGFFAAGEIGPIGERSFLHGHTASLALLRARPGRLT